MGVGCCLATAFTPTPLVLNTYRHATPRDRLVVVTIPMAGLGLSDQKNAARRDHAHRDRRGLFSIHTKYGLLNRLPTKVSFSIFD